jgi:putrescine---pyruvate transaminase
MGARLHVFGASRCGRRCARKPAHHRGRRPVRSRGRAACDHFAEALAGLADHPLVGEARSCGLLGALELVEDKAARRYFPSGRKVGLTCREHCIAHGLVMRAVRDVMILAPPLVITEAEIDEIARRARRALDLTWRDLNIH